MRKKIGCLLTALFMSLIAGNSVLAAANPKEKAVVWALQIAADSRHGIPESG